MYQMVPPQPVQEPVPPQPERGRMSVLQIALIVVVLGFVVWYLVTALTPDPSPYGKISAGTMGTRYTGDCLIVRDETPFDAEGVTSVEYSAEEGATVYRGTTICNVYSSGFSTREMTALQDYRDQIKEYQIKLLQSEVATDAKMEKLESEVMTRAREVREIIFGARGNMTNQESLLDAAIRARQSYLKQKYSEDQRMTRLYDDEQSQMQRISSWTKQYAAMAEGINIPEKAPTPPDTVFSKALGGWYDIVVVMYHDQGHIPLKLKGFVYNKELKRWDAVAGINVTLGLPIIRASVDHGTGEDIAGMGICSELSLVNAIDYAVCMANAKREEAAQ